MSQVRSFVRRAKPLAVALFAAAALTSCSTGPATPSEVAFDVEVAAPSGGTVLALAQIMVGEAPFSATALSDASRDALAPSALTEIETGIWLGNVVDATVGSTVEVTLPAADDVPAGTRASASQAFLNATNANDCQVDASDPAALVTVSGFEGITYPGLLAYTVDALGWAVLSDASIADPTTLTDGTLADGTRIYSWLYSDADVDVGFSGADCGFGGSVSFDADLSLEAGLNTVAWVFDAVPASSALSPASFVEAGTGVWLGNTTDVSAGATVEIVLPNEDEIPPGTLAGVEQAFANATLAPDCTVTASDPSIQMTTVVFEGFSIPGLIATAGVVGAAPVFMSDAVVDPAVTPMPDGLRLYTWIHADGDVDVTFDGPDCDGFDADLSLATGWNTAAWVFDSGMSGWTLSDVDAPDTLVGTAALF